MIKDHRQDFRFGEDTQSPDAVMKEGLDRDRIDKLSRRVTILAVLIPSLIGIVLFFFYLDLKKRVIEDRTTDSASIQSLAQDMDGRLKELTEKFNGYESSVTERNEALEKTAESIRFRIYKVENLIKKTDERIKEIDRSKINKKELDTLSQNLAQLSEKFASMNSSLTDNLMVLTASVERSQKSLVDMRAVIESLSDNFVDRSSLSEELQTIEKQQEKNMAVLSRDVEKKLVNIEKDIIKLEKNIQQVRNLYRSIPKAPAPAPQSGTGKSSSTGGSSGDIIEKDIQ